MNSELKNHEQKSINTSNNKDCLRISDDNHKFSTPNEEKNCSEGINRKENSELPLKQNSNCQTNNHEEDIHTQILKKYKDFQQETGCTDEELFELVMDIETDDQYQNEETDSIEDYLKNIDYGSHEYWDKRYTESDEPFEWYFNWSYIEPEISPFFKGKDLALILGCGNSEMSFDVQKSDIKTVVSIDISKTVIDQMIEKYKNNENLLWFEMDCTDMSFKDDLFDVVFDKGTFDAILCGKNNVSDILSSMSEIWRVLKKDGFFIEISHTGPNARMELFSKSDENWKFINPIVVSKNAKQKKSYTYIYVMQKQSSIDDDFK